MADKSMSRRVFLQRAVGTGALAALSALAAACQQAGPPGKGADNATAEVPASVPEASKETTELKWTQWWPWDMEPGLVKAAETFEQENNVKFVKETVPWDGFVQKMLTLAAADSLPDIFGVNGSHVAPYGYRDVLLDLQPFVERDDFPLDEFFQSTLEIYNYPQGHLVSVPDFVIPTNAAYYNKDLFDKAGVPYPTPDWTFEDILPIAKALTNPDENQYGVEFTYVTWGLPIPLFGAWGGSMTDSLANPTKATFDSPEIEELVNWTLEMIYTHKVAPTPDAAKEMGGEGQMMVTGKLAFTMGWQMDSVQTLVEAKGLKWGETLSPHKAGGKAMYPECGVGYGAPAKSKDQELAWRFLSYACGPQGWEVRLPVELENPFVGWPSALASVARQQVETAKTDLPDVPKMVENVIEGASYPWWILHPGWEEFWATSLTPIGEQIIRREIPVKQGLKQINEACQKMIDNPPPK